MYVVGTLKINLNYTIVPQVMALPEDRSTCYFFAGCIVKTSPMHSFVHFVTNSDVRKYTHMLVQCTRCNGFIAYTIRAEKLKSLHLHITDIIYYVSMLNVYSFLFSLVAAGTVSRKIFFFIYMKFSVYLMSMLSRI